MPQGCVKPWPLIDEVDRSYVMASLEGSNHAFGPNCREFRRESAARGIRKVMDNLDQVETLIAQ